MNSSKPRTSRRGKIFRALAITIIIIAVLVVAGGVWTYYQAVGRFEVRRVSLPTRIFADSVPLNPGVELPQDRFTSKLERLGYREVEAPSSPGEYSHSGSVYDVYLREFERPGRPGKAMEVRIVLQDGAVQSVDSIPEGTPVQTAALEPELLTSILGKHLENRTPVSLDQIPQHLVDAVVVTEDSRFFQHPGIDPIGIFRALAKNIRAGGVSEGGSTLTQQLVKNYYLSNERTIRRKVVEAFMAVILDARYSKREILQAYMNDIYLGRNRSISIMGVGQAAHYYFGKPVAEIDVAEAAMLAGMIRSPNNYSPFDEPDKAKTRRNTVLDLMLKHEKISREEYQKAVDEPLPDNPTRSRAGLTSIPFYVDAVLAELDRDYGIGDVQGRGLSIYTAIDLDWQDRAARRLSSGLEHLQDSYSRLRKRDEPLEGALLAVDVESGEIRALVGGRDYDRSQFNRALSARRQVGSLFKPFVYLAAFEPSLSGQNITPATLVKDSKFVLKRRFASDWSPHNYGGVYHGVVTVRQALEHSMNAASVRVGLAAGMDSIIRTAHVLGVDQELDDNPSLILGAAEIPPITMAQAYTTLARMGSRVPLRTIRAISNDRGRTIAGGAQIEPVQVFPSRDVFLDVNLMEGVIRRGTAARARAMGFRRTAAGKTGTTNDKRDAWFIGFTPKTLAAVWVGFDDNTPVGLSGSEAAVPIWTRFMKDATEDRKETDFPVPAGIVFEKIDMTTGQLATEWCPDDVIIEEAFKSGTQPMTPCQKHQPPPPPEPEYPFDPSMQPYPGMPGAPQGESRDLPQLEGGIFGGDTETGPPGTETGPRERPRTVPNPSPQLPPRRRLPPPDRQAAPPPPAPAPTSTADNPPGTPKPQPPGQEKEGKKDETKPPGNPDGKPKKPPKESPPPPANADEGRRPKGTAVNESGRPPGRTAQSW